MGTGTLINLFVTQMKLFFFVDQKELSDKKEVNAENVDFFYFTDMLQLLI